MRARGRSERDVRTSVSVSVRQVFVNMLEYHRGTSTGVIIDGIAK